MLQLEVELRGPGLLFLRVLDILGVGHCEAPLGVAAAAPLEREGELLRWSVRKTGHAAFVLISLMGSSLSSSGVSDIELESR